MKERNVAFIVASLFLALLIFLPVSPASADTISGSFTNWTEVSHMTIGDGTNHVTAMWSINILGVQSWFYGGSVYGLDSTVAYASGVTSIDQIIDASSYSFTNGYIGPIPVNSFVIWDNTSTDNFGVVQITSEDATGTANGNWWFQTDHSGNFAAVPEPGTLILFGSGLIGVAPLLRRRLRLL